MSDEKKCEFCKQGDVPKDGWHVIDGLRVSCVDEKSAFSDRVEGVPANQG
jgi:hypothetical protein